MMSADRLSRRIGGIRYSGRVRGGYDGGMADLAVNSAAEAMAATIAAAHEARAPYAPLPDARCGDFAFAYAVQDRLVAYRREAGGGEIIGWKIGFTTPHIQAQAGIAEPGAGALLASGWRASGAALRRADFVHLGLEGEIAVRVGEAFPETAPVTLEQAATRLESVAAAFEVTDDRNADWSRMEAASLIADNIWNIGVVVGPPAPAAAYGPLIGRKGVLTINGEVREEAVSEDAGGDPLAIVAWLGAHLARRGQPLRPGQWIMTGSFVATTFPKVGDRYEFAVDGLEPAVATIV
jgi:2-keto-4-pentenoate hydratase